MGKVFRPKEKKIILRKPDYKNDLIYLMQFPVSPTIRSISPFSIKLETYLRLKKIPYEPVYCRKFDSKKRYIPYIELNGEQMSDSNLIIQELEKRAGLLFCRKEFRVIVISSHRSTLVC